MSILLFTADPTLTADMTIASLQEMKQGGYTALPIIASAWCVPYFTAGSAEVSASGNDGTGGFKFSFTATPDVTAFGYAVRNDQAKLVVVETFASSYTLANAGDTLTITPKVRAT
jgi:hypothetical protein